MFHLGQKGAKSRLYLKVFEIAELPAPTPEKAHVEISRGNNKDKTADVFVTGTRMAVWEQELMLPVTMYSNAQGMYEDKEMKVAVKDTASGKTIAKALINVSEHVKGTGATQVKLLLETKSKSFMGGKGQPCPLRVSLRLEVLQPTAQDSPTVTGTSTADFHTEEPSEMTCTDNFDTDDEDELTMPSPGFAPQTNGRRGSVDPPRHSRSNSSANPFDVDVSAAPRPPPKKKGHRRSNSHAPSGHGTMCGGIQLNKQHSSPAVSMNPFDDPSPDESATPPSMYGSSPYGNSTPMSNACLPSGAGRMDDDDLHQKIAQLETALEVACNDARESKRQLDEQKRQFRKMLAGARDEYKQTNIVAAHEEKTSEYVTKIEELQKGMAEQLEENESLRTQVNSLQSALDLATSMDNSSNSYGVGLSQVELSRDETIDKKNEQISWLETELVVAKMKLAEACAAGFVDSSQ
jgi:hypothetical protein